MVTRATSISFVADGAAYEAREDAIARGYAAAFAKNQRWHAAYRSETASIRLVYHRIGSRGTDPYELFVNPSRIQQHLEIAADRQRLLDGALSIEIHFDDGYRDIFGSAVSASKDFGLSVTAFVPTVFLHDRQPYLWDRLYSALLRSTPDPTLLSLLGSELGTQHRSRDEWYQAAVERCRSSPNFAQRIGQLLDRFGVRTALEDAPLTAADIATMVEAGVEFGLHGHSHRSFGFLTDEECNDELDRSLKGFGEIIPAPPRSFAFPYGGPLDLNRRIASTLRRRGVEFSIQCCHTKYLGPKRPCCRGGRSAMSMALPFACNSVL